MSVVLKPVCILESVFKRDSEFTNFATNFCRSMSIPFSRPTPLDKNPRILLYMYVHWTDLLLREVFALFRIWKWNEQEQKQRRQPHDEIQCQYSHK